MKILHLIDSVNPDQGGPLAFALNMARARESRGHSSLFISSDPAEAQWVRDFPFPIVTAPKTRSGIEVAVSKHCKSCDAAIVHGLWNPSTIGGYKGLKNNNIPWVLYPHGMLDPYFKRTKPIKNLIKHVYWVLWQGRMLSEASNVLFTCQEEMRLAKNVFIGHNNYKGIAVSYCAEDQKISNLDNVDLPFPRDRSPERPYLLYLSRIHPKKATDNLLHAFARVTNNAPEFDLVIAGPDRNDYADKMKELSQELKIEKKVIWTGPVKGETKKALFAKARAFILPSHQENFGQVVAEALSAGIPVLISNKVNIWKEIEQSGTGLICNDSCDDTFKMLETFLSLPEDQYQSMQIAARPTYKSLFSMESAYHDLHSILQKAVNGVSR